MKLLILGATGGTGRQLVAQSLEQGHEVTAFARKPDAVTARHNRLRLAQGDILDLPSLDAAVRGQNAVLSALGVNKITPNTILSDGTKNIIAEMERHGVRRLIFESSLGIGDSRGMLGPLYNLFLIPFALRNIFADKEVQEARIRMSTLDWTIVRPGSLTNGPKTGVYRVGVPGPGPGLIPRISRADVADFMLKQLSGSTYLRKAPGLSY